MADSEYEVWLSLVQSNAKAIARQLVRSGHVHVRKDYIEENGQVFLTLDISDGLSS
jgi:hypothetical protein